MEENGVKFTDKLKELLTYAKEKNNVLEPQEIVNFFGDMEIEPDKMDKIYSVLEKNGVDVLRMG